MKGQVATDRKVAFNDVEPIEAPVTVEEALARALKYNLDRRSKEMEVNLASGQYKASLFQLLPKVNAQADYSSRNNDRVTLNRDGSPNPLAQDRTHTISDYGVSWNLLEFGLGYFNAKQAGERIQIAEERRRKAVYALIQDVRSAYWRSACAQVMRDRLKENITLAEEALETARKVESQRLRSPQDELAYQRQLLENLRMLEAVQQELSTAQVELASLMNAPVGQPFELKFELPKASDALLEFPVEKLEELALENNADLRESHHQSQIARIETRKILAQLFPSLSFNVSSKYDTDSFQANQRWNETGLRLSYNLVNLLSAPTQIELGKVGVQLADQRRVMTQMAVLTQLHVARLNLINSTKQLSRASKIRELDRRLANISGAREKVGTRGKLETISANTTALLSEFRSYQALAQSQVAQGRLSAVVGLEFYANNMNAIALNDLVNEIANSPEEIVHKIQSLEQSVQELKAEEQSKEEVTTPEEPKQAPAPASEIEKPKEALPVEVNSVESPVVEAVKRKVETTQESPVPEQAISEKAVEPVVAQSSSEENIVTAEPVPEAAEPAAIEEPVQQAEQTQDVQQPVPAQPLELVAEDTKSVELKAEETSALIMPEASEKTLVPSVEQSVPEEKTAIVDLANEILTVPDTLVSENEPVVESLPPENDPQVQKIMDESVESPKQPVVKQRIVSAKKKDEAEVELLPLVLETPLDGASDKKERTNEAAK